MELWDLYNEKREKTDKTIVRGEKLPPHLYHIVVHIWIENREGQLLIQKRAKTVESNPGMWAMTGGSALSGDDSTAACAREMFEEIGIETDLENSKVAFTLIRGSSICDVWVVRQDINLDQCNLQKEEVSEVKWASMQEILQMIDQGKFVRYDYLERLQKFLQLDTDRGNS